ncbi:MAG: antibiotic biosynthesis monooxygenase family protein [Tagaea sp.]
MIVVVFRSRLRPEAAETYPAMAAEMSRLAQGMPGYISHKGFVAADGERVTIAEFESEEAVEAWRVHDEHRRAKRHGFTEFFAEFSYRICAVLRDKSWTRKA